MFPAMTCTECGCTYCYTHAGAHPGRTCRQWLAARASELKANNSFVTKHTISWYVAGSAPRPRWSRAAANGCPRCCVVQPQPCLRPAGLENLRL